MAAVRTNITGDIVAPPGAVRVRLGIKLDNSTTVGTQYFDDYTLTESSVTVALVAAKGFESTVDGFAATNQASIATTTVQAHGGSRSLQVTPTAGGWNITDTAGVAVTAGGVYQLTGWARRTGWGTFSIAAEWRNASNTVIATTTIGEPDMGETWRPFATSNLAAPAGATQLRVRFTGWTTDLWYFDDITVTAITATAGTPTTTLTERRYYQLAGTLIGSRTRDTITNIDVWHYYLGDSRGSTSLAVQRGSTTVQTQWYDPYGKPRGTATITTTDRGYIGQYEDTTTNLNYLNNRYHDPTVGVFLSVDPLVASTGDPYLYAAGNPVTYSDSEGLCAGREGSRGGCGIDYYGGGNGDYGGAPNCGQGRNGLAGGFCNSYGVPGPDDSSWDQGSKYISLTACGYACDDKFNDELFKDFGWDVDAEARNGLLALAVGLAAYATGGLALGAAGECAAVVYLCATILGGAGRAIAPTALDAANGGPGGPEVGGLQFADDVSRGFGSMSSFRRAYGSAGADMQWHHIVEQNPTNIARFGSEMIQNTSNIIRLDAGFHTQVSAYYSSIQPFTGGHTVRQWVTSQSFDAQVQFGLGVLKQFGAG